MGGSESGGGAVAEIQGLYGPFSFPERLLQAIWLRRDFDGAQARTTDGRPVCVLSPGRWNRLGGPDFKDARLRLGDIAVVGDIEVHLREGDWRAHGHAADPAYNQVVLHVVLFPTQATGTTGAAGRQIPVLVLLPLLHHDLEEYAADEALERLADRPMAQARLKLLELDEQALLARLRECARQRWMQKVRYARVRLERLGWRGACHHTALEVLGYRFNRAAMLSVAAAYPLDEWVAGGERVAELAFGDFGGLWCRQGGRPQNHPQVRLRQYAHWAEGNPEWPERLSALAAELPDLPFDESVATAATRRRFHWPRLQALFRDRVFVHAIGGTRANTLICDGFLPLLAAADADPGLFGGLWNAWPAGDVPDRQVALLRDTGVVRSPDRPLSHGAVQGLLGWLLSAEISS